MVFAENGGLDDFRLAENGHNFIDDITISWLMISNVIAFKSC